MTETDDLIAGLFIGGGVLSLAVFVAWVLWSECQTRRAWRIQQARCDENARTLAYIAETDPAAFVWREVGS